MEDDVVRLQSAESIDLRVPGMNSVVATVSGYHGLERHKLIRLIDMAGGSYVGSLNQSTTHLVCWKFEGRKYDVARKLKTKIVNHRWLEDCIKQGRFLSEHPYTLRCGEEVGPVLFDISVVFDKRTPSVPYQSTTSNDNTKPVIDITGEETDDAGWVDSSVLKENLLPELGQTKDSFSRSKRKLIKTSSKQDNSSRTRDCFKRPSLPRCKSWETEELSSPSPPPRTRLKTQNDNSAGTSRKGRRLLKNDIDTDSDPLEPFYASDQENYPSRKGRRLLKNDIDNDSDPLELFYASDEENDPTQIHHRQRETIAPSSSSCGSRNKGMLRLTRVSKKRAYDHMQNINDCFDNAEDFQNISDCCAVGDEEFNDKEPVSRLPASMELSCVICWTDFSSTRGILPCGHRFCFSCIQSWADHMDSSGKTSTCPLCKANFVSITKVDEAVSSDQKIYSQTIPNDPSNIDVYILPERQRPTFRAGTSMAPVCCQCCCREPEDLLIRCQLCEVRCIHSYCMDPPTNPWMCIHCRDLRMIYR